MIGAATQCALATSQLVACAKVKLPHCHLNNFIVILRQFHYYHLYHCYHDFCLHEKKVISDINIYSHI